MIAWRPKAALSHLEPLRLTPAQFEALPTDFDWAQPGKEQPA